MNRYTLFAILAAVLLIAACGTPTKTASNDDDDDKVLVTGSRIPVKGTPAAKPADHSIIDDINRQIWPQGGASGPSKTN